MANILIQNIDKIYTIACDEDVQWDIGKDMFCAFLDTNSIKGGGAEWRKLTIEQKGKQKNDFDDFVRTNLQTLSHAWRTGGGAALKVAVKMIMKEDI